MTCAGRWPPARRVGQHGRRRARRRRRLRPHGPARGDVRTPRPAVRAVADRDVERARAALGLAGADPDRDGRHRRRGRGGGARWRRGRRRGHGRRRRGRRARAGGSRHRPARRDGHRGGRRASRAAAGAPLPRGGRRLLPGLRRPARADLRARGLGAHGAASRSSARARARATCRLPRGDAADGLGRTTGSTRSAAGEAGFNAPHVHHVPRRHEVRHRDGGGRERHGPRAADGLALPAGGRRRAADGAAPRAGGGALDAAARWRSLASLRARRRAGDARPALGRLRRRRAGGGAASRLVRRLRRRHDADRAHAALYAAVAPHRPGARRRRSRSAALRGEATGAPAPCAPTSSRSRSATSRRPTLDGERPRGRWRRLVPAGRSLRDGALPIALGGRRPARPGPVSARSCVAELAAPRVSALGALRPTRRRICRRPCSGGALARRPSPRGVEAPRQARSRRASAPLPSGPGRLQDRRQALPGAGGRAARRCRCRARPRRRWRGGRGSSRAARRESLTCRQRRRSSPISRVDARRRARRPAPGWRMSTPETYAWQVSMQTPSRGSSMASITRGEVGDVAPDGVAGAGRVLEQQPARRRRAPSSAGWMPVTICGSVASRPRPLCEPTWNTTPSRPSRLALRAVSAQRVDALAVDLGVVRGQVDEVDRVRDGRPDAARALAEAPRRPRLGVLGPAPGPRVLREDLERLAAELARALRVPARRRRPTRRARRRAWRRTIPAPWGSASASPRRRRATCTSAACAPRSTTGCSRATRAASPCCASRTPTSGARRRARSSRSARSLDWLGLDFDESPARGRPVRALPPERAARPLPRGRRAPARRGQAYPDYRTPEEVERGAAPRRATPTTRRAPTRAQRELTREQVAEYEAQGRLPAIRFRGADRGRDGHPGPRARRGALGAPPARRPRAAARRRHRRPTSSRTPSTTSTTRITHVIRGDDLLPSTPRQRLLVEALGAEYPVTGHLAMILGPGQEAPLEAPRRGLGGGVPRRRLPARGGRQLPRAAGLELGRHHGADDPRRARGALHARAREPGAGGLRPPEAGSG